MNGKLLSGPAAVLLIVLFFLPWISVSCDDEQLGAFSGLQLASGTLPEERDERLDESNLGSEPILFVVPLAGGVTILLLGITLLKRNFEENAGWGRIIAALLGVLVLVLEWLQLQSQNDSRFEILLEPAMWGTVACLLFIGIGGLLDVVLLNRRPYSRGLGSRSKRSKHASPAPFMGDPMGQIGDSGRTILDDGMGGAYGSATILDDAFAGQKQYGSETILDEDFGGPQEYDGATILNEDFVAGRSRDSGATILDEDLIAGRPADSGATILDDQLFSSGEDDNFTILSERRSGMEPPQSALRGHEPESAGPTRPPKDLRPTVKTDKTEVLHAEPEVISWLVITNGERAGEQFRLRGDTTIGRAPSNDIVLDDTALSGQHVRIRLEHGRIHAQDLQSTNGLYVLNEATNGWEKQEATELRQGSQIKLGRIILRLVIAE